MADKNNSDIRILVVDDEPTSRFTLEGKLRAEPYALSFAVNGREALDMLETVKPHVILMDVMMPEMDGFTACRHIKEHPQWKHIPVIMVTALDDRETLRDGFDAGANDFVSKSASAIELRARVRSMVQIKQQYDDLAELLRIREDMANMVAHDMRNPLTSILGYSQLLSKMELSREDVITFAEKIHSETRRLNNFITDMLLMAKMEHNHLVINPTRISTRKLLNTAKAHHQIQADTKDMTIVVDDSQPDTFVNVDANLFQRVVDNLVSNAIKYAPAGSTITLKTSPIDSDSSHTARIEVADEGLGIPDEEKGEIFGKFDTGIPFSDTVTQIGLGLAFSKMVVAAHQGIIYVTDNQPSGAIFVIEV